MNRLQRLTRPFAALAQRVNRRGSFLLFLSMLDLVIAFSLFFPAEAIPPTQRGFLLLAPTWVWGAAWGLVGIVTGVQAFMQKDAIAFACAAGIKFIWSVGSLLSWLYLGAARGYTGAAVWATFGLLVLVIASWPDPPANVGADYRKRWGKQ